MDYTKSFNDLAFGELRITTSTNEASDFNGDTIIFLKEMSANYVK